MSTGMPEPSSTLPRLVIASHNRGKLREIAALLAPFRIEAVSAGALGLPEPEETGATFEENAALKARISAQASGLPALSDDSGLCIPALSGAPGIYSARWAGADKDFSVAFSRIERELAARGADAASGEVAAYFICVLCLAFPDGREECFEGRVDGTLCFPPKGARGFGYDPIFIPSGYRESFGEMEPEKKHAISHRHIAFEKFIRYLNEHPLER